MNRGGSFPALLASLSVRERVSVGVAAAAALAAALYAFLWEPGLAARERLGKSLPQLRAQLAEMRAQQAEIAELRKRLAAAPRGSDLRSLLQASLGATSFASAANPVEPVSEDRAAVRIAAVDFQTWIEWLQVLRRDLGVRVASAKILALEEPGVVRIEATFSRRHGTPP